jgi:hypothetical protein
MVAHQPKFLGKRSRSQEIKDAEHEIEISRLSEYCPTDRSPIADLRLLSQKEAESKCEAYLEQKMDDDIHLGHGTKDHLLHNEIKKRIPQPGPASGENVTSHS